MLAQLHQLVAFPLTHGIEVHMTDTYFEVTPAAIFKTVLMASILLLIPYWKIFKKAGFTPVLSILMIVPLVNLVVMYLFAFAHWKVVPIPGTTHQPPPR
jgi:hypothetical protein